MILTQPTAKNETYYFATKLAELREREAAGQQIMNLGIGSPDLPPPESAVKALVQSALEADSHRYQPYRGQLALREAFADWYFRTYGLSLDPAGEILPLLGSKAGVVHCSSAFLHPGDKVLVPNPGYPAYAAAAKMFSALPLTYNLLPENNWLPDIDALEQQDLSRVQMMWISYPHMPTGAIAKPEDLKKLVDFARRNNIILINDNPYSLILNSLPLSLLQIEGAKSHCLELNSLSKSHNLAGMRVGVCVGSKNLVDQVLGAMSNVDSGMYKGIQAAAIAALKEPSDWLISLNEVYVERREFADQIMEALGCTIEEPQAGLFRWARIPDGVSSAEELSERVLDATGVFITPGHIFGTNGQRYLRISLCSPKETLSEAFEKIRKLGTKHFL